MTLTDKIRIARAAGATIVINNSRHYRGCEYNRVERLYRNAHRTVWACFPDPPVVLQSIRPGLIAVVGEPGQIYGNLYRCTAMPSMWVLGNPSGRWVHQPQVVVR